MAKLYNLKSAYDILSSQYDLEPNIDEFEDLAMSAWEELNNKHTRLYRYIGDTDEEGVLELPCNADRIESVTIRPLDVQLTSPTSSYIAYDNINIEHYIERTKLPESEYYAPGQLIEIKEGDGVIYLPRPCRDVCVIYHGVLVDDEDGLPLINQKEQKAIAVYVAYALTFKESLRKKDANLMQFADKLYQLWLKKCTAARIPEYLTQNEMNKILEVKNRWDRKSFKHSFKPII